MRKMLIPLLALAAVLVGCAAAKNPVSAIEIAQFEGTVSRSFKLQKYATITLELAENATTGYMWRAVSNEEMCRVTLEHVPAEAAPEGVCGAPGKCIVRITALKSGLTTVKLEYMRPWENEAAPASRLMCAIEVTE